jgi:hypothetical protein
LSFAGAGIHQDRITRRADHESLVGDHHHSKRLVEHLRLHREPDWSPRVDWDGKQAAVSRRKFLSSVADTDTLILPIHFPTPTAGLVKADGDRFHYRFKRE